MRTLALCLALLLPVAAQAQLADPEFDSQDFHFLDVDGSGTRTCGDWIQYHFVIQSNLSVALESAFFDLTLPPHAEIEPTSLIVANPNELGGPVEILSGDQPGDSVIRVSLGRVCVGNSCPNAPSGATVQFRVRLANPNPFTSLSVQGQLSGANFATILSGDLDGPGNAAPSTFTYPACPGGGGGGNINVSATKTDALITDQDGDGLADAGDRVRYSVQLRNTGTLTAPASVFVSPVDPNSALVIGSVTTTQGTIAEGNTPGSTRVRVDLGTLTSALVTVRFDAIVRSSIPVGVAQLSCQGVVSGPNYPPVATDDPTLPGTADPTTTPLDFDADLFVTKSDGGVTAEPGEVVVYTVTPTNRSPHTAARNVVLTETVPQHTTFEAAASSPGWSCTSPAAGATCTAALGTLGPLANVPRLFAVRVVAAPPPGTAQLANTVTVAFNPADGPDPTPADNTATDTTPLDLSALVPDLSIVKTDGDVTAAPGDVVVYTLSFANSGLRGATGVRLTETVPTHATFEAASSSPGWSCTGATCTLNIGNLLTGNGSNRLFAVRVANPIPPGVNQITNTVQITDDGTGGPDPTPANNTATDTTPVLGSPVLTVSKTAKPASDPSPGGLLLFDLAWANTGNAAAENVVLEETVPANTTFDAASSSAGWSCTAPTAGSPCTLSLGTVPAGSSGTAVFAVRLPNPFPPGLENVENCAAIDEGGGPARGGGPSCATVTIPTTPPDLALTKSDGGISTDAGERIPYNLTYQNLGGAATGVELVETVPAHTTFDAASSAPAWSCQPGPAAGSTCRLPLGTLPTGAAGSVVFAVVAANPLPAQLTQIVNTALILDDGNHGADSNPANNLATDTTPVEGGGGGGPEPQLHATKTDALLVDMNGDGQAGDGDRLLYTVEIDSSGLATALGVVFFSAVPEQTTLQVGTVTTTRGTVTLGNSPGDTAVRVELGDLAPSARAVLTFEVELGDPLPPFLTEIQCQGLITAGNHAELPTDDPDTQIVGDPTRTPIVPDGPSGPPHVVEIPTLNGWGLGLMTLLLVSVAWFFLRHRGTSGGGE